MKNVKRIDEFKNNNGAITEVEIKFEDNSKVVFKGEMKRSGSLKIEVKRIDEFKTEIGILNEIEITFIDGSKISYKAKTISRKGNM